MKAHSHNTHESPLSKFTKFILVNISWLFLYLFLNLVLFHGRPDPARAFFDTAQAWLDPKRPCLEPGRLLG